VDLLDGILKARCYQSRRNDTSFSSSKCVFSSFWKEDPLGGGHVFVDFQGESFAMLHTVFDQASFKRLEGAKSDLQHEKKNSFGCTQMGYMEYVAENNYGQRMG
jgi:hypothetical protein